MFKVNGFFTDYESACMDEAAALLARQTVADRANMILTGWICPEKCVPQQGAAVPSFDLKLTNRFEGLRLNDPGDAARIFAPRDPAKRFGRWNSIWFSKAKKQNLQNLVLKAATKKQKKRLTGGTKKLSRRKRSKRVKLEAKAYDEAEDILPCLNLT